MKIKNCPFCGSDNVVKEHSERERVSLNGGATTMSFRYQVACRACGCQTGFRHKLEEAFEAWNRRCEHE